MQLESLKKKKYKSKKRPRGRHIESVKKSIICSTVVVCVGGKPPHGTDTLLLALSAADLLLLLCLPFHTAAIALGSWPFGSFLCKVLHLSIFSFFD